MIDFALDTLVWTGALIALALVLRRPVARAFGPGLAYALWLLPLLRLAMPPLVLPRAWLSEGFAPVAAHPVPAAAGADTVVTTVTVPVETQFALPWELLLGAAWIGGAVLFLAVRVFDYRAMRRRLLSGAIEVDRREGVRLVETPAVDAPVAFGVRDKVVALPPRFLISGAIAERALAVEHELAHHRGRDLLANWLAQPILALHWFNPLAWAAWNAMRRDQEAACDARTLAGRDLATRAAYARVIASFAAGERLQHRAALAAPMACPISLGAGLGDKSIVHRLRSLTMTDLSPRRRRAGRWALAIGGALALPLTATVVYAGQDAPPPPPTAPVAPEAPSAPNAPKVVKHVVIMTEHGDHKDGDKHGKAKFEKRVEKDGKTVIIRSDKPISEAELEEKLAKIETIRVPDASLLPGERREFRKIIMHNGEGHPGPALAMVMNHCKEGRTLADVDAGNESATGGKKTVNRTRLLICGKNGERGVEALAHVRIARERIAGNDEMPAEVRAQVLQKLDEAIVKLESEGE